MEGLVLPELWWTCWSGVLATWAIEQTDPFWKFQSLGIEVKMRQLQPQMIRLVLKGPSSEFQGTGLALLALIQGSGFPLWIPIPFGLSL